MASLVELIEHYFRHGYKYKEILLMLSNVHEKVISIRQLHRILRVNGFYRKRRPSSIQDVCNYIE